MTATPERHRISYRRPHCEVFSIVHPSHNTNNGEGNNVSRHADAGSIGGTSSSSSAAADFTLCPQYDLSVDGIHFLLFIEESCEEAKECDIVIRAVGVDSISGKLVHHELQERDVFCFNNNDSNGSGKAKKKEQTHPASAGENGRNDDEGTFISDALLGVKLTLLQRYCNTASLPLLAAAAVAGTGTSGDASDAEKNKNTAPVDDDDDYYCGLNDDKSANSSDDSTKACSSSSSINIARGDALGLIAHHTKSLPFEGFGGFIRVVDALYFLLIKRTFGGVRLVKGGESDSSDSSSSFVTLNDLSVLPPFLAGVRKASELQWVRCPLQLPSAAISLESAEKRHPASEAEAELLLAMQQQLRDLVGATTTTTASTNGPSNCFGDEGSEEEGNGGAGMGLLFSSSSAVSHCITRYNWQQPQQQDRPERKSLGKGGKKKKKIRSGSSANDTIDELCWNQPLTAVINALAGDDEAGIPFDSERAAFSIVRKHTVRLTYGCVTVIVKKQQTSDIDGNRAEGEGMAGNLKSAKGNDPPTGHHALVLTRRLSRLALSSRCSSNTTCSELLSSSTSSPIGSLPSPTQLIIEGTRVKAPVPFIEHETDWQVLRLELVLLSLQKSSSSSSDATTTMPVLLLQKWRVLSENIFRSGGLPIHWGCESELFIQQHRRATLLAQQQKRIIATAATMAAQQAAQLQQQHTAAAASNALNNSISARDHPLGSPSPSADGSTLSPKLSQYTASSSMPMGSKSQSFKQLNANGPSQNANVFGSIPMVSENTTTSDGNSTKPLLKRPCGQPRNDDENENNFIFSGGPKLSFDFATNYGTDASYRKVSPLSPAAAADIAASLALTAPSASKAPRFASSPSKLAQQQRYVEDEIDQLNRQRFMLMEDLVSSDALQYLRLLKRRAAQVGEVGKSLQKEEKSGDYVYDGEKDIREFQWIPLDTPALLGKSEPNHDFLMSLLLRHFPSLVATTSPATMDAAVSAALSPLAVTFATKSSPNSVEKEGGRVPLAWYDDDCDGDDASPIKQRQAASSSSTTLRRFCHKTIGLGAHPLSLPPNSMMPTANADEALALLAAVSHYIAGILGVYSDRADFFTLDDVIRLVSLDLPQITSAVTGLLTKTVKKAASIISPIPAAKEGHTSAPAMALRCAFPALGPLFSWASCCRDTAAYFNGALLANSTSPPHCDDGEDYILTGAHSRCSVVKAFVYSEIHEESAVHSPLQPSRSIYSSYSAGHDSATLGNNYHHSTRSDRPNGPSQQLFLSPNNNTSAGDASPSLGGNQDCEERNASLGPEARAEEWLLRWSMMPRHHQTPKSSKNDNCVILPPPLNVVQFTIALEEVSLLRYICLSLPNVASAAASSGEKASNVQPTSSEQNTNSTRYAVVNAGSSRSLLQPVPSQAGNSSAAHLASSPSSLITSPLTMTVITGTYIHEASYRVVLDRAPLPIRVGNGSTSSAAVDDNMCIFAFSEDSRAAPHNPNAIGASYFNHQQPVVASFVTIELRGSGKAPLMIGNTASGGPLISIFGRPLRNAPTWVHRCLSLTPVGISDVFEMSQHQPVDSGDVKKQATLIGQQCNSGQQPHAIAATSLALTQPSSSSTAAALKSAQTALNNVDVTFNEIDVAPITPTANSNENAMRNFSNVIPKTPSTAAPHTHTASPAASKSKNPYESLFVSLALETQYMEELRLGTINKAVSPTLPNAADGAAVLATPKRAVNIPGRSFEDSGPQTTAGNVPTDPQFGTASPQHVRLANADSSSGVFAIEKLMAAEYLRLTSDLPRVARDRCLHKLGVINWRMHPATGILMHWLGLGSPQVPLPSLTFALTLPTQGGYPKMIVSCRTEFNATLAAAAAKNSKNNASGSTSGASAYPLTIEEARQQRYQSLLATCKKLSGSVYFTEDLFLSSQALFESLSVAATMNPSVQQQERELRRMEELDALVAGSNKKGKDREKEREKREKEADKKCAGCKSSIWFFSSTQQCQNCRGNFCSKCISTQRLRAIMSKGVVDPIAEVCFDCARTLTHWENDYSECLRRRSSDALDLVIGNGPSSDSPYAPVQPGKKVGSRRAIQQLMVPSSFFTNRRSNFRRGAMRSVALPPWLPSRGQHQQVPSEPVILRQVSLEELPILKFPADPMYLPAPKYLTHYWAPSNSHPQITLPAEFSRLSMWNGKEFKQSVPHVTSRSASTGITQEARQSILLELLLPNPTSQLISVEMILSCVSTPSHLAKAIVGFEDGDGNTHTAEGEPYGMREALSVEVFFGSNRNDLVSVGGRQSIGLWDALGTALVADTSIREHLFRRVSFHCRNTQIQFVSILGVQITGPADVLSHLRIHALSFNSAAISIRHEQHTARPPVVGTPNVMPSPPVYRPLKCDSIAPHAIIAAALSMEPSLQNHDSAVRGAMLLQAQGVRVTRSCDGFWLIPVRETKIEHTCVVTSQTGLSPALLHMQHDPMILRGTPAINTRIVAMACPVPLTINLTSQQSFSGTAKKNSDDASGRAPRSGPYAHKALIAALPPSSFIIPTYRACHVHVPSTEQHIYHMDIHGGAAGDLSDFNRGISVCGFAIDLHHPALAGSPNIQRDKSTVTTKDLHQASIAITTTRTVTESILKRIPIAKSIRVTGVNTRGQIDNLGIFHLPFVPTHSPFQSLAASIVFALPSSAHNLLSIQIEVLESTPTLYEHHPHDTATLPPPPPPFIGNVTFWGNDDINVRRSASSGDYFSLFSSVKQSVFL